MKLVGHQEINSDTSNCPGPAITVSPTSCGLRICTTLGHNWGRSLHMSLLADLLIVTQQIFLRHPLAHEQLDSAKKEGRMAKHLSTSWMLQVRTSVH
eukprot:4867152-Amphidinium_carterae.1